MDAFTLRNVSFAYPGQRHQALSGVTLSIREGEFFVFCGPSGGGKTTLLRLLKPLLAPYGNLEGEMLFEGQPLQLLEQREQSAQIGFVQQSPEHQLVTDKVWHELAFGLESLGCDTPVIRRRVAEMAEFFGISKWFYRDVASLSGGQKQILNLASVMVLQPQVLILDEPTAQLDPIAASDFLALLGKINRELGTTVILSEQRLEEAFSYCHRAAVLEEGMLRCIGTPKELGGSLRGSPMSAALPAAMRVWTSVGGEGECPVTVREGRAWLAAFAEEHPLRELPAETVHPHGEPVIEASELRFRYEKDAEDVVRDLSLMLHRGELLALLGGNGAGKTTTLKLLAGARKPYSGRLSIHGRTALLPQDVQTLFCSNTVRKELEAAISGTDREKTEQLAHIAALCRLEQLLDSHPYDLSGGEQQRAALAKILLTQPDILLLDEPTKGLDARFKAEFAEILKNLLERGVSVLMVSHDVEFCARYAHRCALLFDGAVAAEGTARTFFGGNAFYTTAAERMARGLCDDAVTTEDLIDVCGGTLPPKEHGDSCGKPPCQPPADGALQPPADQRSGAVRRAMTSCGALLLLIPMTLFSGSRLFGDRKYYFVSLLILLECMLPFFVIFERRKPRAREIVTVSVLCGLAVAGRAALFMLPQCKPVMAVTILAGAALGGETGFLVGAVSMLVSNILFSQGPWTPWQMFAMGMTGFLAGLLFHRNVRKTKLHLSVFGALAAVFIYGGIMNPASALMWAREVDIKILLPYYISGFPMDCVQAAATAAFLWFLSEPMLEKLERVKRKYGLML